jgi:hypothetical protein
MKMEDQEIMLLRMLGERQRVRVCNNILILIQSLASIHFIITSNKRRKGGPSF